ncbi:MAG: hypothetical protein WKF73_10290 [Nocardioidaceae bacterium]
MLELLDWMRDNTEAALREALVDTDDPDLVEAPSADPWKAMADFLEERQVATLTCETPVVVSINDPELQQMLDLEVGVRAILDGEKARAALLEVRAKLVHLDNAAVRLSSETGRDITQACALALYDTYSPDVIHYRSRHDDSEGCWAIYGRVAVVATHLEQLSAENAEHAAALRDVSDSLELADPADMAVNQTRSYNF